MPTPRYEEIAADLREKIREGHLRPGQQLKTEKELAAEYGAARNTIRDAITRLKALRLLETRPGRGTFVVQPPEIFRITLTPEEDTGFSGGEGKAWVREARKQERKAATSPPVVEIQQADKLKGEALDIPEGGDLVGRHQRRYISDKDGNSIPWSMQTSYYPFEFVERGATELMRPKDIEEGAMSYLEEKLGIRQAAYKDVLRVRPPDENETKFFDLPPEGSVQIVEHRRTAYDVDGRPCRYTITVYPTDRNEFVIEAKLPLVDDGRRG
ncbi:transcriptional regulator [Actinomadura rubrobrunea]|uniref:Transcriptional regulator n=1 Tax=Actinomadura rubrobrunea TaxID=115335 RepID=A0A9W6PYR4_9ACTN|nr:GntR family transcriptional regulator [Actinomadura rubrobrunea]GLW65406.1 transcriptional regulator [Actinomadura rubrobrunea]